ncbi:MAG: hypothetical protein AAGF12_19550 [Myxococcota bacterium]
MSRAQGRSVRWSFSGLILAAGLIAWAAACVGTPQPDPPNFDPDQVYVGVPVGPPSGGVSLLGRPGSAEGGDMGFTSLTATEPTTEVETLVWSANLDVATPTQVVVAEDDGSFEIFGVGSLGDEVRIQVRGPGGDAPPVDVVLDIGVPPAPRPLSDCLTASPPLELFLGRAEAPGQQLQGQIRIQNDCAEEVSLTTAMRVPTPSLEIVAAPTRLQPGSSGSVQLRWTAGEPLDDVLLIEVSAPIRDRRPITLRAAGPG